MSHYVEIELEMTGDPEDVVKALLEVGGVLCKYDGNERRPWDPADIEVHAVRQSLYGYMGDEREQKAHIIIRRHKVGGNANDIGFEKLANGKWAARISEHEVSCGYDPDWQKRVLSRWAVQRVGREATARGCKWREESREVDGKQYVFVHVTR